MRVRKKERDKTIPRGGQTSGRGDAELAGMAKALGHPARVAILRFLVRRGECMCGDIVEHLPLAQSTVSQHLKVLKEAGLLAGEVDGPRVCYCVNPQALERMQSLLLALGRDASQKGNGHERSNADS